MAAALNAPQFTNKSCGGRLNAPLLSFQSFIWCCGELPLFSGNRYIENITGTFMIYPHFFFLFVCRKDHSERCCSNFDSVVTLYVGKGFVPFKNLPTILYMEFYVMYLYINIVDSVFSTASCVLRNFHLS